MLIAGKIKQTNRGHSRGGCSGSETTLCMYQNELLQQIYITSSLQTNLGCYFEVSIVKNSAKKVFPYCSWVNTKNDGWGKCVTPQYLKKCAPDKQTHPDFTWLLRIPFLSLPSTDLDSAVIATLTDSMGVMSNLAPSSITSTSRSQWIWLLPPNTVQSAEAVKNSDRSIRPALLALSESCYK